MSFKKIVSVDNTGLDPETQEKLRRLAAEAVFYEDFPRSNQEIIARIGDADCVLVSWNTPLDQEVIQACTSLKYIGMCCSLIDEKSANVDIAAARAQGIKVLGVRDYGDEGVIEFIISELVRLLKGTGAHQWKLEEQELTGQTLGIIGMGTLGTMLAETAQSFGMQVYYYSRTRKPAVEDRGVKYLELDELLPRVDILSTHLPRNTVAMKGKLHLFGENKILINTSLGPTFAVPEFSQWIQRPGNYAIFDGDALGREYQELVKYNRVIYTDKVAGWTQQAKLRLSQKVLANIHAFLEEQSE